MKIHINISGKILAASLADNVTARDFASVLLLNVTMKDGFGREKYGGLPKTAFGERSQKEHYPVFLRARDIFRRAVCYPDARRTQSRRLPIGSIVNAGLSAALARIYRPLRSCGGDEHRPCTRAELAILLEGVRNRA